jgi:hypothetical protein
VAIPVMVKDKNHGQSVSVLLAKSKLLCKRDSVTILDVDVAREWLSDEDEKVMAPESFTRNIKHSQV